MPSSGLAMIGFTDNLRFCGSSLKELSYIYPLFGKAEDALFALLFVRLTPCHRPNRATIKPWHVDPRFELAGHA